MNLDIFELLTYLIERLRKRVDRESGSGKARELKAGMKSWPSQLGESTCLSEKEHGDHKIPNYPALHPFINNLLRLARLIMCPAK